MILNVSSRIARSIKRDRATVQASEMSVISGEGMRVMLLDVSSTLKEVPHGIFATVSGRRNPCGLGSFGR